MVYKDIGKKIQKAREELGLSQEELSKRLGYSQAALSNYELGKRRLYLANIEQIAKELKKPISFFLDEPAESVTVDAPKKLDRTTASIVELLSELPDEEREYILEYIQWRRDRLR